MPQPRCLRAPLLLFLLSTALPSVLLPQDRPDSLGTRKISENTLVTVNRPGDMFEDWWLYLRNGTTIACNRSDITLAGDQLKISGTLRDVTVPRSDVSSIMIRKSTSRFRDGFFAGAYLGSALFFSPTEYPGYFLGTRDEIPGSSPWSYIFTAVTGLAVGALTSLVPARTDIVTLDGTESDKAWRLLTEGSPARFHIRGRLAYVFDRGGQAWKDYYERNGGTEGTGRTDDKNSNRINVMRMLTATISAGKKFEAGIGLFSGGQPQFARTFSYYSGGAPPVLNTVNLFGELSTTGYYFVVDYLAVAPAPQALVPRVGVALGWNVVHARDHKTAYYYTDIYPPYDYGITPAIDTRTTNISAIISGGLEYYFDHGFSLAVTADYAFLGRVTLPPQQYRQTSTGDTRFTLPGADLDLTNSSIGLQLGWHL